MKSIILTNEQHEIFKQSIILELRKVKDEINHYTKLRDEFENVGKNNEALYYCHKLTRLYDKADEFYNLLFKLVQS